MFCNKFPSVPSMLHLSPAKILGKVVNFILSSYPEIIKVWLAKISFWYHSPSKYYRGKTLVWVVFDPPLVPEGLSDWINKC